MEPPSPSDEQTGWGVTKGVGENVFMPSSILTWSGDVPPQKWMNFYTKVLTKLGVGKNLTLTVKVECSPEGGLTQNKIEEIRSALRELGLDDQVK